jgi:hypothetical protein
MDSATTRVGLPFDVLGVIFDYYRDEKTIQFSLETMLSVCRSWNEAAPGHRNLWARLKIYIGHFPTSKIWKSRLPRRLERAGDSTPLEIDLRSILDSPNPPQGYQVNLDWYSRRVPNYFCDRSCNCAGTARRTVKELLVLLAGPHGELCHRWKSLYLYLGLYDYLGKEMTYPTPNLEAVWLERPAIALGVCVLPSLPKLKTFKIFRPFFFIVPKIDNVRNLVILDSDSWETDLSNLRTATNVETIEVEGLRKPIPYSLPQLLPHLSSMSFIGNHLPSNLNEVQAPNIRRLSLTLADNETLQTFVGSYLPLWDLQELEITWSHAHLAIYEELRTTTSDLLLSCISLTCIKADRRTLSVIVKLYWEECATRSAGREHIMGKTLSFWSIDVRIGVNVRRPEGKSELEGVALSLGLTPPSMSWDYMLACL